MKGAEEMEWREAPGARVIGIKRENRSAIRAWSGKSGVSCKENDAAQGTKKEK